MTPRNFREPIPCPICGGPMNPTSRKCCSKCLVTTGETNHKLEPCPICGKPKDKRSKTCRACRYPDLKGQVREFKGRPRVGVAEFDHLSIDPLWAAEFSGFFMGEGTCLMTQVDGRKGLPTPVVAIHLRRDDRPILEEIRSVIGGRITNHETPPGKDGYQSKPQSTWAVSGFARTKEVLSLLKKSTSFPAKKRRDVEILLEYILWRETVPCFPSDSDKETARKFKEELSSIKIFSF